MKRGLGVLVLVGLLGAPALAFQVATPIHRDCHERLTHQALLRASARPGFPATTSVEDERLADSLQFDIAPYGKDRLIVSLLEGARYNDVRENSTLDLVGIVPVHSRPERQQEHCLRRSDQDGEEGSRAALEEAREFIRAQISEATGGRDRLDPGERELVQVFLLFQGAVPVSLSRLYFHLGRAVHTVQDSFSHTLRSADGLRIVSVCNWIDDLQGSYREERDGCPHHAQLDDCECEAPSYTRVREAAVQASTELLVAVFSSVDARERSASVERFLDRWLGESAGCSLENGYCGNALRNEVEGDELRCPGGKGCALTEPAGGSGWLMIALIEAVFLLGVIGWRRRAALRRTGVAGMGLLLLLAARPSSAGTCLRPDPEPGLYLHLGTAVSSDRAALEVELGGRYRWRFLGVGLAAEYNPFIAFERGKAVNGAFNLVASGSAHVQLTPRLSMRFELRAGVSVLLFETPGYALGDVGLFLGLRALGLDYRLVRRLYLLVDPVDVAVPVFKLAKLPFYYRQWRVGGALAWRW